MYYPLRQRQEDFGTDYRWPPLGRGQPLFLCRAEKTRDTDLPRCATRPDLTEGYDLFLGFGPPGTCCLSAISLRCSSESTAVLVSPLFLAIASIERQHEGPFSFRPWSPKYVPHILHQSRRANLIKAPACHLQHMPCNTAYRAHYPSAPLTLQSLIQAANLF